MDGCGTDCIRLIVRRSPPQPALETKVMQIFEGTNQIQRLVISRDLAR
jgi:alkylation response protein AidB-like acyl-CoA dehydrogenase